MERRLDSCIKYTIVAGKKVLAVLSCHVMAFRHNSCHGTLCCEHALDHSCLPEKIDEYLCSIEGCLQGHRIQATIHAMAHCAVNVRLTTPACPRK